MTYIVCILCEKFVAELAPETHPLPTCHCCRMKYAPHYIAGYVAFLLQKRANLEALVADAEDW